MGNELDDEGTGGGAREGRYIYLDGQGTGSRVSLGCSGPSDQYRDVDERSGGNDLAPARSLDLSKSRLPFSPGSA